MGMNVQLHGKKSTDRTVVEEARTTNGAIHTVGGTIGGSANTAITSWPHTLATFTSDTTGTSYNLPSGRCTVQATTDFNGGSAITATIDIQVSNDNDVWISAGTIALSGDNDSDGFNIDAPWAYIRADVSAWSVTGSTPQVVVTLNI